VGLRIKHAANDTKTSSYSLIMVQVMQEDEDGNALTTVKPDVAAVLRAKRETQPDEFIRYHCTDQSEHLKKIFECECCFQLACVSPMGKNLCSRG